MTERSYIIGMFRPAIGGLAGTAEGFLPTALHDRIGRPNAASATP